MEILRVTAANYSLYMDMVRRRMGVQKQGEDVATDDLANRNLYVYAAQEQGAFIGWISLVYIPKIGKFAKGHVYVDELYTEPEFRRRGVARALLRRADELKEQLQASGVRLYVNTENPGARALYEACGYQRSGQADYMEK